MYSHLNVGWIGNSVYATREFPKFILFGSIAALTTLSTGWLLYGTGWFPRLPYWFATGTGAALGLIVNFTLNYIFNFAYRGRSKGRQFVTFFIVSGFGVLLTGGLSEANLYVLNLLIAGKIHLGQVYLSKTFAANVAAVALVALYSFPAHKLISFNVGLTARLAQLKALIAGAHPVASRYESPR